MFTGSELYSSYKELACITTTYIIINLYVNYKRLSAYQGGKTYINRFSLISCTCIAALLISCMVLETTIIPAEQVLPLIFSLLVLISAMCLSAYKKVIATVQENTEHAVQLEKNRMEKNYIDSIEQTLTQLRTTRHDLKNQLIIIDAYAKNGETEKISEYIEKILSDVAASENAITSPCVAVSSLLNAKQQLCSRYNISFQHSLRFSAIHIDESSMIAVLGNMMDNAITAAAKMPDGYIHLKMQQLDSQLNIYCENNHCETITLKDDQFISTKQDDGGMHGLGIRSIKKTVSSLHGNVNIDYSDTTFCIDIMVPNYS